LKDLNNLKNAIYFIGLGMVLVVYAHANFSTKDDVLRLERHNKDKDTLVINRLDRIESKLDDLILNKTK